MPVPGLPGPVLLLCILQISGKDIWRANSRCVGSGDSSAVSSSLLLHQIPAKYICLGPQLPVLQQLAEGGAARPYDQRHGSECCEPLLSASFDDH